MPKIIQRIEKTCPTCGKIFYVRPKLLEKGQGIYCSQSCYTPPLIKNCTNCGKEFRTSPAQNHKFCSQECSWSSPVRNKEIGKKQSALHDKPEFREKFISWIKERTASEHWRNSAHFQKGERHPAYRGNATARENEKGQYQYKKWRSDVYHRDDFTCQHCGKRGGRLHAHHIKEWAKYPELRYEVSNGLTLCEPCHKEKHKHR